MHISYNSPLRCQGNSNTPSNHSCNQKIQVIGTIHPFSTDCGNSPWNRCLAYQFKHFPIGNHGIAKCNQNRNCRLSCQIRSRLPNAIHKENNPIFHRLSTLSSRTYNRLSMLSPYATCYIFSPVYIFLFPKSQKPYIENYLLDGRCALSNNVAENAIRRL